MRNAFTLIELVVVMVVLGLMSSIVVYSLGDTMDRHRMSAAIETFELFDARARRAARYTQKPVVAAIDPSKKRLSVITQDGQGSVSFKLSKHITISEIRYSKRGSDNLSISARGLSNSYAVKLKRGELSSWLLVLGGSGQVLTSINEREVNAMLSL